MITGKEILLALTVKYQGNWDDIYNAVKAKEHVDEEYATKIAHDLETSYVTLVDEDYPEQFHNTFKPPFVLFYQGDLSLIKDTKKSIAILGSQDASVYSTSSAQKIAKELHDMTIISSFGDMVNDAVLSSALKNNKPTVAIVRSGLCTKEVQSHPLYNDLVIKGLILSEMPPKKSLKTDKKLSTISIERLLGTVTSNLLAIECYDKDSTMLSIAAALNSNGNVYVLPQPITSKSLNDSLINDGANIVVSIKNLQQDLDDLDK